MMKALSVALKDLQLTLKDPGTWVNLFVFPLVFVFIFGGGFDVLSGAGADEVAETQQIVLPTVNLDEGGALATMLLDELAASGTVALTFLTRAEADRQLDLGNIRHVLVVPAGFSAGYAAGEAVELRLINYPTADISETEALQLAIDGVAQDLVLERQLVASLEQMGRMQAAAGPDQQLFATERIVAQARNQFAQAQERPLITIARVEPGPLSAAAQPPVFSGMQVAVPGFAVLFVFLAAQSTAQNIFDERKYGSFRRLLAAPISKFSLLLGKMTLNFIMALLQIGVIFAAGLYLFPLIGLAKLSLGVAPWALLLLSLLVALCSTCLGVLIAAVARTENQIGGLSTLVIWGTGILGGSMVPLFLMSDALDAVGKAVPQYWAVKGFYNLLVLSGGLADITLPLLVLAGFSVLFFGLGLWRFEYQ